MRGYFMTVQEFLYGGILDEQIVEGLAWQYPGSSDSQIRAWRDLVQRLRNCDRLRYLPGSCVIVLEYELPTSDMAIDLMICGYNQGGKKLAQLIEVKQWGDDYIGNHRFSEYRGEEGRELHPQVQVSRHECSFKGYLDVGGKYLSKAYVYLPNATENGIWELIGRNPNKADARIPCQCNLDQILSEVQGNTLNHMVGGDKDMIRELMDAAYQPFHSIINAVKRSVNCQPAYHLTEEQDKKIKKIIEVIKDGNKVIRISGAAGSGKTAILLTLFVEIESHRQAWGRTARLSLGAQNTHLYRNMNQNASQIFQFSYSLSKDRSLGEGDVLLIDEAQHNKEGLLSGLLKKGCQLVLCYDEQQTITPENSLKELKEFEAREDFVEIRLKGSVRYNGSETFEKKARDYVEGNKVDTRDDRYDFQIAESFTDFQYRLQRLMASHPQEETAVIGLLSEDAKDICGRNGSILYTKWTEKGEKDWFSYVLRKEYDPSNIWVGTWWMPGLDADYVAVIAGGDVTWTPQGLHLNIGQSKHYKLMIDVASCLGIPISYAGKTYEVMERIKDYLQRCNNAALVEAFQRECDKYVTNIYYIMATRGRKGLLIYFDNRRVT